MAPTRKLLSPTELGAWRGMLETHSALIARLDDELVRQHDLPLTSYEVLMNLVDAEGGRLRMGELADRLLLSRSGVTRLVDRLERQGLVTRQRCDEDARGFFAALTDEGRLRVQAARPTHLAGVRRDFLRHIDDEERRVLAKVWSRILSRSRQGEAEPAGAGAASA